MQQQKINKTGCLYLCPTPIGNILDISLRIINTLKTADYILAEDTRVISSILKHYKIHNKVISYHRFSERRKLDNIINDLNKGIKIALVSNAGTPAIQDPGELLVKECIKNNIKIVSIPGPFAGVTALSSSGISTHNFTFIGFLPKKEGERLKKIYEIKDFTATLIIYEAPHRLLKVLECLCNILGNRNICIARELTKKYEELLYFTLDEAVNYYKTNKPLGEFALIIEGAKTNTSEAENKAALMLNKLNDIGIDKNTAIKITSKLLNLNKNKVYKISLSKN